MKKLLGLFLILTVSCLGKVNRLTEIRDVKANAKEVAFINGEKKEKEYEIEYISKDYLRKVILYPKINKGEIYLYENGKSRVYIPLFDEVTEEKNEEDINSFLAIINELKEKDRTDKNFIQNYYNQKVKELKYKGKYKIVVKKYKKVQGFLLPVEMEIYENKSKVGQLALYNIVINQNLKRKGLK